MEKEYLYIIDNNTFREYIERRVKIVKEKMSALELNVYLYCNHQKHHINCWIFNEQMDIFWDETKVYKNVDELFNYTIIARKILKDMEYVKIGIFYDDELLSEYARKSSRDRRNDKCR